MAFRLASSFPLEETFAPEAPLTAGEELGLAAVPGVDRSNTLGDLVIHRCKVPTLLLDLLFVSSFFVSTRC